MIEVGTYLAVRYDKENSVWIKTTADISVAYSGTTRSGQAYTNYKVCRSNSSQSLIVYEDRLVAKIDTPNENYMYSNHMSLEEMQEAIITYYYSKAIDLRDKSEEILDQVKLMQDLSVSKLKLV